MSELNETSESSAPIAAEAPVVNADAVQDYIAHLRTQQNLYAGILAALGAALVGAGAWVLVAVLFNIKLGWLAIGVGALVGYAMRVGGKGIDPIYGYIGGAVSLVAVAAGNLFTTLAFVAQYNEMSFFAILLDFDYAQSGELMVASFSPMDMLFYGLAVYQGYKISFKPIDLTPILPAEEAGEE